MCHGMMLLGGHSCLEYKKSLDLSDNEIKKQKLHHILVSIDVELEMTASFWGIPLIPGVSIWVTAGGRDWGYAGGRACATAMERLTSRFTQMVTLLNKSRSLCNMPLERSKTQSRRTR